MHKSSESWATPGIACGSKTTRAGGHGKRPKRGIVLLQHDECAPRRGPPQDGVGHLQGKRGLNREAQTSVATAVARTFARESEACVHGQMRKANADRFPRRALSERDRTLRCLPSEYVELLQRSLVRVTARVQAP
ncbi:hypothetical protein HPB49_023914 [Dermacentor silvarum]|uniref:Uncharacterized protein n=1 Tax=Dermacentor silvarum TaxID=543639 RepID=A0ACB8DRX3_DERSI|nr:hypothetical protein HPB49_023914 [Dermacentor silvarum]